MEQNNKASLVSQSSACGDSLTFSLPLKPQLGYSFTIVYYNMLSPNTLVYETADWDSLVRKYSTLRMNKAVIHSVSLTILRKELFR